MQSGIFNGQRIGSHSRGQPDPHTPRLQPGLHALPPQAERHSAFVGHTSGLHCSGQPASHGLHPTLHESPPQDARHSALNGQSNGLHSSGHPDPQTPKLQPTLHGLPPQDVRQRALSGHRTALQRSGQPPLHGFPPQRRLQLGSPQWVEQVFCGQVTRLHSCGHPDPQTPKLQPTLHALPPHRGAQTGLPKQSAVHLAAVLQSGSPQISRGLHNPAVVSIAPASSTGLAIVAGTAPSSRSTACDRAGSVGSAAAPGGPRSTPSRIGNSSAAPAVARPVVTSNERRLCRMLFPEPDISLSPEQAK